MRVSIRDIGFAWGYGVFFKGRLPHEGGFCIPFQARQSGLLIPVEEYEKLGHLQGIVRGNRQCFERRLTAQFRVCYKRRSPKSCAEFSSICCALILNRAFCAEEIIPCS